MCWLVCMVELVVTVINRACGTAVAAGHTWLEASLLSILIACKCTLCRYGFKIEPELVCLCFLQFADMFSQCTSQRCQPSACHVGHSAPAAKIVSCSAEPQRASPSQLSAPCVARHSHSKQPLSGRKSLRMYAAKAGDLAPKELMKVAEEAAGRGAAVGSWHQCLTPARLRSTRSVSQHMASGCQGGRRQAS